MRMSAETDDLQASIIQAIKYLTSPDQPDTVPEHVLIQNRAMAGHHPTVVRDALEILAEKEKIDRIEGERGPHYRLAIKR